MAFADRRSGVVTTDELLRAGSSDWGVQRLIAQGVLHRLHRPSLQWCLEADGWETHGTKTAHGGRPCAPDRGGSRH